MPSPQDYNDRREAYCAWLQANNIEPGHVLLDADVYIEPGPDSTRNIVYEACHLDSDGRRQMDERGTGVAIERRTTPLLVDPPDWWEPYRKPTREQLLEVVDRVRALHREEYGCCAHCTRADSVLYPCPTIQALEG